MSEQLLNDTPPKTLPGDAPKKRGRPPVGSTPPKASADVEQALAVLENAYSFLVMGLTLVGATDAAGSLAEKIEYVQTQNRGFLIADKKLAAAIGKVGATSGRAGFVVTNFMVLAPVVLEAMPVIRNKFGRANVAPVVVETQTAPAPVEVVYPPVVSEV
jgi:hypothetical protein